MPQAIPVPMITEVLCEEILIDSKPCCAVCYANAIADPAAVAEEVKSNPNSYKGKILSLFFCASIRTAHHINNSDLTSKAVALAL